MQLFTLWTTKRDIKRERWERESDGFCDRAQKKTIFGTGGAKKVYAKNEKVKYESKWKKGKKVFVGVRDLGMGPWAFPEVINNSNEECWNCNKK